MNLSLLYLMLSVVSAATTDTSQSNLSQNIGTPECQRWVDSVYNTLSDKERVAQLMVVNCTPGHGEASKNSIRTMVDTYHVGGMFLSKGTARQFAEMTNYAQSLSKVPLMMCIDGEWGPAMRVTDAPLFPNNMALGAVRDPALIELYGAEVARECRALGIQVDFAPVLDVNSNPKNPVIGYRSFGENPQTVALMGRAFSVGLENGGVMAVGKHFPGHGDTSTDSHKTLPTVSHSKAELDSVDMVPFRSFIDAGCSGVMVGHLAVPALDASKRPASMSHKITTDLLKQQMGFNGLVFTDGLGMKGAAVGENVCVAAIKAGHDVLVGPNSVGKDIDAVLAAVKSGAIPKATIEERCRRVLAWKYALGLSKRPEPINPDSIVKVLNSPEAETVNQLLADAAITVLSNKDSLLPLTDIDRRSIAVVNIGEGTDNEFAQYCRRYAKCDVYSIVGTPSASTVNAIKAHDVVIAAVYNDNAEARSAMAALGKSKCLVQVYMVNAYKMAKFKASLQSARALVIAYDNTRWLQKAAAEAVFGGIDVSGRMPVNVPGVARVGEGIDLSKSRLGYSTPEAKGMKAGLGERLDRMAEKAMADGAFPGAQVMVVKDGDIIIDRCYGYTTKGGEPVTPETLYDLASVSKTVGTLPGVMKAYDLGLFDLDASASTYIPPLGENGKGHITPRTLLYHETGMPASLNVYNLMMDPATYTGRVIESKRDADHTVAITGGGWGHGSAKMRTDIISKGKSPEYCIEVAKGMYESVAAYDTVMNAIYTIDLKPSRNYLYSCLNFCLLMDLEQRLTGIPHQQWITDSVWAPIGAYNFTYRPTEKYPLSQISATENDTYLRKQHVRGYVHDELAAFSGGVQGNAGVFGTATDIAKLCQTWLNGGTYGGRRVFGEETNRLFTTDKSKNSRRGLGFDKPDTRNKDNSPTCDEASAATYGHTGFTGTCFWVDPDSRMAFIFLSNRVDPTRDNKAFSKSSIRSNMMSEVYRSIN